MKLLRITAEGLPLFKRQLDICLYAQQRISEEQKGQLYPLFSNVYLNPANGFIGINASGKTSVLKVILLALGILNNDPINHIETRDILGDAKKATLNIYFYSDVQSEVCRLETIIASDKTKTEGIIYSIVSESIWTKKSDEINTRKAMLSFDEIEHLEFTTTMAKCRGCTNTCRLTINNFFICHDVYLLRLSRFFIICFAGFLPTCLMIRGRSEEGQRGWGFCRCECPDGNTCILDGI